MTRWGIVSTIKAPPKEVLNFVAYHLDLGAHHITIYLDNENPKAFAALTEHPKVTVIRANGAYWRRELGKKPARHQVRQSHNASHAYVAAKNHGLDWLLHIDGDEFLCPTATSIPDTLAALPSSTPCARVFPAEAMSSDECTNLDPDATYCKAWEHDAHRRARVEHALYPLFGTYVRGGFVSHTLGKTFLRTGLPATPAPIRFRIHRAMRDTVEIGPSAILTDIDLCHIHIKSWETWAKTFDYRLDKGSYRKELGSVRPPEEGGMSLNQLFSVLIEEDSEDSLRAFFDEICLARPELLGGLQEFGLLRVFYLDLDAKRDHYFPDWRK